MLTASKVIWSEGMLLQPQHFQQHDRYLENLIQQKSTGLGLYNWGFSALQLDEDLLAQGKVGIKSAKGIMPDGTPFDVPFNDQAPTPLQLHEGEGDLVLNLALPLKKSGKLEVAQQEQDGGYRYQEHPAEVLDTITANNEPAKMIVGKLGLQILRASDQAEDYALIPFTIVKEVNANKQVILDQDFIVPALSIAAAPKLLTVIQELQGLLSHRSEMLSHRLTDAQQSATAEIADFMLLQLVNRYEPYFHHLCSQHKMHPEQLYQVFLQLMGEISTFTSDKRRPIVPPNYQHEDLLKTFAPVIKALRHSLSMVLEQNAVAIKLIERQYGIWAGEFNDPDLLAQCDFVLAVYADMPTEIIRNNFPNQVKIAPVEQIRNIVSRALPGIDIQAMPVAPRQIPYHANFSYFMLNKGHEYWQQLKNSAGIAFHVGGSFPGLKLELWAIKG